MTTSEIKFLIQKNTPSFVFKLIYSIWTNLLRPINEFKNNLRLKSFNSERMQKVKVCGEEFDILISPHRGTVDNEIFLQGSYEPEFLKLIKNNLDKGDTFVDIGANIGQHSLFASEVVEQKGKVISFEPIPLIYDQFNTSIAENNKRNKCENIYLYNYACGEKDYETVIYTSDINMGASSMVDKSRGKQVSIKVIKADEILKLENRVDLIKIDVEGYEYEALIGLEETIKKFHPKVIIEYSPCYYVNEKEVSKRLILEFFLERGYEIFDLEDNNNKVDMSYLEKVVKNKILQTNFLAVYAKDNKN